MKQDIVQLRSGGQRLELKVVATPSAQHTDTDMWSSSQSTTTAGIMTPSEHESDDYPLAVGHERDRAEDLLEAANGEFTQKDLAGLVYHWTGYSESSRNGI